MAVTPETVLAQWSTLVEGLQWSPKDFYGSVEQAIQRRQLPDIFVSRVNYAEGGPFSAKREYLRVTRKKDHIFDICGAPFGTGFFSLSWLGGRPRRVPWVHTRYPRAQYLCSRLFARETYYKIRHAP